MPRLELIGSIATISLPTTSSTGSLPIKIGVVSASRALSTLGVSLAVGADATLGEEAWEIWDA